MKAENELVKHADLITDVKVKAFILKKKDAKREKDLAKWARNSGGMSKDVDMEIESEVDSDEDLKKPVAKVKKAKINKNKRATIKINKSKHIKKQ